MEENVEQIDDQIKKKESESPPLMVFKKEKGGGLVLVRSRNNSEEFSISEDAKGEQKSSPEEAKSVGRIRIYSVNQNDDSVSTNMERNTKSIKHMHSGLVSSQF